LGFYAKDISSMASLDIHWVENGLWSLL